MPGPRQPIALLEARGAKHMGKAEKAERAVAEVKVDSSKPVRPPKWLPDQLKKEFRRLEKQLRAVMPFCVLDAAALGRYLVAQDAWEQATVHATEALAGGDLKGADAWSTVQDRYFKQCRHIAGDMGLTITSRCRLVLPPGAGGKSPEENPFDRLMREREERQRRA